MELMPGNAKLDLAGQRILVTGAGRGLGRGMALTFADWGASLGLADIGAEDIAETRKLLEDKSANLWSGRMDVTGEADVQAALRRLQANAAARASKKKGTTGARGKSL